MDVVAQLPPCRPRRLRVAVTDLREPGDAGLHGAATRKARDLLVQLGEEDRPLGAWTDDAHLASKHIPELGQLVEVRATEKRPDASHSRVVRGGPNRPRLLLRVRDHAPELEHQKRTAAEPGPFLPEEDR